MKKKIIFQVLVSSIILLCIVTSVNGQSTYIPADSTAPSILAYTFSGGSFQSYGCSGVDPTYWLSGSGDSVTVNFVNTQTNPSFRVWGMNDDDSAEVFVNTIAYPLTANSASYDTKVICNTTYGSPGPDGVVFSSGLLVGANSNSTGNYSYQNVTLQTSNVNSFTIVGKSGNGWGFAGVTIIEEVTGIHSNQFDETKIVLFPNPTSNKLAIRTNTDISDFNIEIVDLFGRSIFQQEYSGDGLEIIDLSQFPKGSYILVLKTKNRSFTKKILKQ